MNNKNVGKTIYENNMETRITVRLDNKHNKIIEKVLKEKKFNNKSEVIRYIIENYKEKN